MSSMSRGSGKTALNGPDGTCSMATLMLLLFVDSTILPNSIRDPKESSIRIYRNLSMQELDDS